MTQLHDVQDLNDSFRPLVIDESREDEATESVRYMNNDFSLGFIYANICINKQYGWKPSFSINKVCIQIIK